LFYKILIGMKIIITESQKNRLWLLRRYELVKESFDAIFMYIKNPCKFNSFEHYERTFVDLMMDELHPEYYLINNFDYDGIISELKDLFYVELTELYYERNC
jgi:hypothetical protein